MVLKIDITGQDVALDRADALGAWNAMILEFLAHGARTGDLLGRALEIDPDFALGHAVRGLMCMMLARREMIAPARDALARSRLDQAGTARERAYSAALAAWLRGRPSHAVVLLDDWIAEAPGDALAVKCAHAIRFMLGDAAGMRRAIERVLPAYEEPHPAAGYVRGCHAFALEETGAYDEAEAAGRLALALAPNDAWGLHAVAHVHEMRADPRAGLAWLDGRDGAWMHCNNFRYHVWWHKALMHLELGELDQVFMLYDEKIRADRTDDYRDIANAVSLLWRLHLDGIDVGDRWEELAALSEHRADDGLLVFADLHYLLGLVGGGRGGHADALIGRMRLSSLDSASETPMLTAETGLSAAAGLAAFGAGDYRSAFANLARARPGMQRLGGSHAQRDVFERLTIDSAIRAGYPAAAAAILDERRTRRGTRKDRFWMTRMHMIECSEAPREAAE